MANFKAALLAKMKSRQKADMANSFGGLAKETIKGIPKAAANLGKAAVSGTGKVLNLAGQLGKAFPKNIISVPKFKKGGMVKKTGLALVHKGEKVMTKEQVAKRKRSRMSNVAKKVMGGQYSK